MRIATIALLCACAAFVSHAQATTAFTYQGQLQTSEGPVTDTVDLEFSLYETKDGSNQVGSITRSGVEVEDGLFQVELDFGAGAFDGSPRYLEIAVDNGEPLAPRQPVSPSPTAMLSLNVAEDAVGTAQIVDGAVSGNELADPLTLGEISATRATVVNGGSAAEAAAVHGEVTDTGSENFGVKGVTNSTDDYAAGVLGVAEADSGLSQGVRGVAENGIAVEATNTGQSGFQLGLWANVASDSGQAIQALASASSGSTAGVYGRNHSPDGAGVEGRGEATSGNAIGVLGKSDSPDGYGVWSEDLMRSEDVFEADAGVVHRQRGEPTPDDLADGEVMVYNSDGSDEHNAGDLVYAINDGGSILTQTLVEKANASSLSSSAEPASRPKASLASDRTLGSGRATRIELLERDNRRKQKRIEELQQQLEQQQQRLARLEAVLLEDRRVAEE